MKKIIILLFFVSLFLGEMFSQTYTLQMMDSDTECYLELYDNRQYIIKLSHKSAPDLMLSSIFSFGGYSVDSEGTYTLTDRTHAYCIRLERASESTGERVLFVKNAFGWMQNNYFVKSSAVHATPIDITQNFLTADEVVAFREKLLAANTHKMAVAEGRFSVDSGGFSLNLRKNGTYTMRYHSLPLSEGTWTIGQNVLELWDEDVDARFHAIVLSDGTLRSALLPGEFSALRFNPVKK